MKRKPVKDLSLDKARSWVDFILDMAQMGGFQGKVLGEALLLLEEMIRDGGCKRFLSFTADLVASGLRGILRDMVKKGWFHAIITTTGTLDHDIARCYGEYLEGTFDLDDAELRRQGLHRLGSIIIPQENYGPSLERLIQPFLEEIYEEGRREIHGVELCKLIGERICNENSILYWAQRLGIPVLVPGLADGAIGSQIWLFHQRHRDFKADWLKDEETLAELVFGAERLGGLVLGGGISKHHLIWWAQFNGGLDYALYITTASEYDGSLSGARVKEAVSWGKVKGSARQLTLYCDATLALPILAKALTDRLG